MLIKLRVQGQKVFLAFNEVATLDGCTAALPIWAKKLEPQRIHSNIH